MKKNNSILKVVDSLKSQLLSLTSSLIKAKSENPPGDTSEVAIVIEDKLKSIGLNTTRIEPIKGHVSVISEIGKGDNGLILCGHIDTVPIGDKDRWNSDPFSGKVAEGRIFGRGSTDMKGGVSSILMAMEALSKFESELDRKISVVLLCDEETGGKFGANYVTTNQLIKGDSMIIGECSNYHNIGHAISAGEKGLLWANIKYYGTSHHGSRPMLGDNAILKNVELLKKIKPISKKVRPPYSAIELFKWGKITLKENYKDKKHLKPHYAIDHYTLNVGKINGGIKTNIVSDFCETDIDLRIPIGGNKKEAEQIIEGIAKYSEINYTNYASPSFTPSNNRLVKILRATSQSVFNETTPPICMTATTDAHFFRTKMNIPVVIYGPGYEEACHSYDESVDILDLLGCVKVYALTALELS